VIPDLIKKIGENDVVQILGDGTQIRNFVHAADVARFVELATRFGGQRYFNLRSNLTITIADLARDLARFLERDVKFAFEPSYMRFESFRIRDFDLAPAKAMGWAPRIQCIADGMLI
jgi:nucleoside-diphosphate-sugar epimerase